MPEVCVACEKDNHQWCMGGTCVCPHCCGDEDNQLRMEQTYGRDRS